jgi:hypothetical protein
MKTGAEVRQATRDKKPRKGSRARAPRSLEEALDQGWKISEDLTSWDFRGSNRREGFIFLRKKGQSETLMLRCVALYELGRPYFLEA